MRLSEKARVLGAEIQVAPTSRGWTVRAFYFTKGNDFFQKNNKFVQKRWMVKEDVNVNDHRFTDLNRAFNEAIEWLEREADHA